MTRLRSLLRGGLSATAALWEPVEAAYDWVFRAAAILANAAGLERQHATVTGVDPGGLIYPIWSYGKDAFTTGE